MSAYAVALAKGASFFETSALPLRRTNLSFDAFTRNGWVKDSAAVGTTPLGGSMLRITWTRSRTGQFFDHTYDIEAGLIHVNSVRDPIRGLPTDGQGRRLSLPDSTQRSDLTTLDWMFCTGDNQVLNRGIRCVELCNIANKDTLEVIDKVFEDIDGVVRHQPGRTFFPDDGDAFKALLGTPDASVFFYMLVQHKEQLGHKRVESIRVYCESLSPDSSVEGSVSYFMVLNISEVPGSGDSAASSVGDSASQVMPSTEQGDEDEGGPVVEDGPIGNDGPDGDGDPESQDRPDHERERDDGNDGDNEKEASDSDEDAVSCSDE